MAESVPTAGTTMTQMLSARSWGTLEGLHRYLRGLLSPFCVYLMGRCLDRVIVIIDAVVGSSGQLWLMFP